METVAVIDIGKTNAKVALVDLATLSEVNVLTTPNTVLRKGLWPHFDTARLEAFILDALKALNAKRSVDALSITTHGACAALIGEDGVLAAPVLDYECTGPETLAADYNAMRPPFFETGSPRLPMGLNLGAQIHWQFATEKALRQRTKALLPWPQYWGFKLTGEMAADVTSLGCHTDLWSPAKRRPSSLLEKAGWRELLPKVARPDETLGGLTENIAAITGIRAGTPVKVGIHDSNASLLPHLLAFKATAIPSYSVVSTGTWVISMAMGGLELSLDPARDTLINVNAFGDPVPSARFMGGREYDLVRKGDGTAPTAEEIMRVLANTVMLLPAVEPSTGPFQGRIARWTSSRKTLSNGERMAALSFYLALMTDTCLSITGAQGPIIVEGPFARNAAYCMMLEAATGRPVIAQTGSATGTAIGAALLCAPSIEPAKVPHRPRINAEADMYAALWRELSISK
jgi:sugar (pentulose or hexulose) kinase